MTAPEILVVEDEDKIARLLCDYLERDGFRARRLARGDEVVEDVRSEPPDLVLLDVMLPGMDGLAVCRELRRFSEVPVIMLTARVEEVDRLIGLELGADDYVCKPFSPREVVMRVRAVLRRAAAAPGALAPDGLVRTDAGFAFDGTDLELTRVETRLLAALLATPGRIWSRPKLMGKLYTDGRIVSDRTIDSHVKNLRRKLQAVAPGEEWITSVYGAGYKMAPASD